MLQKKEFSNTELQSEIKELKALLQDIDDSWQWWREYQEDRSLHEVEKPILKARQKLKDLKNGHS